MAHHDIRCRRCGDPMRLDSEVTTPGDGPHIDLMVCPREGCDRKAAVVFEPDGGLTTVQQTWVEQQIARFGAFFPSDYAPAGPRRG